MPINNLSDAAILVSLINLGLFGGLTHCSGMCGPFVLSQISSRLLLIKAEKYTTFGKLKNFSLISYHSGRICTYSMIGVLSNIVSTNVREISIFNKISSFFLVIASLLLIKNALNFSINFKFFTNIFKKNGLIFSLKKLKFISLDKLFKEPFGFKGFLLGIILGFIPCGLLYAAFALCASISSPYIALFGCFLFGLSTFPALFITGYSGYVFFNFSKINFTIFAKIIMVINGITLFLMAIK